MEELYQLKQTNKDTEVNKTFLRYVPPLAEFHCLLVQF